MKRVWIGLIAIVLLLAAAGLAWQSRGAVGSFGGMLAAPSEVTTLTASTYGDQNVSVKVALTEGKYVVAVAALNRSVVAVMQEGDNKAYITSGAPDKSPAYSYNELTPERLANVRVIVYPEGKAPVKKPMLALAFGHIADPIQAESVGAFKTSLAPR